MTSFYLFIFILTFHAAGICCCDFCNFTTTLISYQQAADRKWYTVKPGYNIIKGRQNKFVVWAFSLYRDFSKSHIFSYIRQDCVSLVRKERWKTCKCAEMVRGTWTFMCNKNENEKTRNNLQQHHFPGIHWRKRQSLLPLLEDFRFFTAIVVSVASLAKH